MRSRMLIAAVAAVTSLVVLVPSNAFAHAHRHSHRGGAFVHRHHKFPQCSVNIHVVPRQIVSGEAVTIFGRLRCANPADAVHQEVKLFHHLLGTSTSGFVQSTTTDGSGFYVFSGADGTVETNRYWWVRAQNVRSPAKGVRVAALVTLVGPPEGQLLTGFANRVTFTGLMSPADAGARVILQRQNATTGNQWHRIDSGVVSSSGSFTVVHTFIVPGDANIRVLVLSQRRNVPSASNVLTYSVSQAQNPQFTIQASADPIVFGESVTISGKFPAGPSQPVTLLARGRHQHGFARIAEVSTNAAGEYSFPPQTPVNNTFYRAQTARPCPGVVPLHGVRGMRGCGGSRRVSSAVLYEGVKDVLTAQVSATTVQAGQSVTFSGSVSPDHTGHVIYLERQNPHGPGFHVIQIAYVGAGSSYSIVHQLYDPGTKVLRVFIPGGPENLGAASAPFTIQVTPAPASALMPEAPGNSTLPSEGQS